MADTWHEDVITIVHTRLDALLTDAGQDPIAYAVGKKAAGELSCCPRIVWVRQKNGGSISPSSTAGGTQPQPLKDDAYKFTCTIWHTSVANCRATLHNLVLAARKSTAKRALRVLAYDLSEEAHADQGALLDATVELTVQLTDQVCATVAGDQLTIRTGIIEERADGTTELVASQDINPIPPV